MADLDPAGEIFTQIGFNHLNASILQHMIEPISSVTIDLDFTTFRAFLRWQPVKCSG